DDRAPRRHRDPLRHRWRPLHPSPGASDARSGLVLRRLPALPGHVRRRLRDLAAVRAQHPEPPDRVGACPRAGLRRGHVDRRAPAPWLAAAARVLETLRL
ncbi:MAG: hypothetical protein AVDCRST_MAG79-2790, partial [uncultured Thermoleophilia bacterium]